MIFLSIICLNLNELLIQVSILMFSIL